VQWLRGLALGAVGGAIFIACVDLGGLTTDEPQPSDDAGGDGSKPLSDASPRGDADASPAIDAASDADASSPSACVVFAEGLANPTSIASSSTVLAWTNTSADAGSVMVRRGDAGVNYPSAPSQPATAITVYLDTPFWSGPALPLTRPTSDGGTITRGGPSPGATELAFAPPANGRVFAPYNGTAIYAWEQATNDTWAGNGGVYVDVASPRGLLVDLDELYFATEDGLASNIWRMSNNVSAMPTRLRAVSEPVRTLALDTTHVYAIAGTSVVSFPRNDANPTGTVATLAQGARPWRLLVDRGYVYFTDRDVGKVRRVAVTGGTTEDVCAGLADPWGLARYGSDIYVTESAGGRVLRFAR